MFEKFSILLGKKKNQQPLQGTQDEKNLIKERNKKKTARVKACWWLLATIGFSSVPIGILLYSRLMLFDNSFGWEKVLETVLIDPLNQGNLLFIAISCSIAAYIDFLFSPKRKEFPTKALNYIQLTFWIIIVTVGITYTMVSLFNGSSNGDNSFKINDTALRTMNGILFLLSATYAFYTKAIIIGKS